MFISFIPFLFYLFCEFLKICFLLEFLYFVIEGEVGLWMMIMMIIEGVIYF